MSDVRSRTAQTDRLRTHWLETGPEDGHPVVLVHGNLSTCRFWDAVLAAAPPAYRFLAVDMRGFGDSEPAPLDGTRGLRDWADDTAALLRHLGIDAPPTSSPTGHPGRPGSSGRSACCRAGPARRRSPRS